jgi:hypothetical protein
MIPPFMIFTPGSPRPCSPTHTARLRTSEWQRPRHSGINVVRPGAASLLALHVDFRRVAGVDCLLSGSCERMTLLERQCLRGR